MTSELPDELHQAIIDICRSGDDLARGGQFKKARDHYWKAFDVVPEPRETWEATTWIISAIADSFFLEKNYEDALNAFQDAVRCPGGLGNVFVHLRLGECYFELNDMQRSGDNLTRAYMGGGREAFEEEDPRYFAYLKTILKPPAGQSEL